MDKYLAWELETNEELRKKIAKIGREYLHLGLSTLNYWCGDFDFSFDLLNAYAPLTKADFDNLERGHPKRFILPVASTQIITMATMITQALFGADTPHKVEGRGPEDEVPAEFLNQILRWNAEQQPTFVNGMLWVLDALTANRGIFYNSWQPLFKPVIEETQVRDPESTDEDPKFYTRHTINKELAGGFCRSSYVSPYDFVCDPSLPLGRLQEGRFAGHRCVIPFVELERRSKLPMDHPQFVLPSAIQEIKEKKSKPSTASVATVPSSIGPTGAQQISAMVSRTSYERSRAGSPAVNNVANREDIGILNTYELWIKLVPADYEIYGAESPTDVRIFQILMANEVTVLAVNESTYAHGEFPYSVAEARPNGLYAFSPSWMQSLKGLQDTIDYLKNRHLEAQARTTGNIFICDTTKIDVEDLLNPEKEGLIIPLKESATGSKISDVIQQVPIRDMTENFHLEMQDYIKFAEATSGASSQMQGLAQGDSSATEYAGSTQMGQGRMVSIARLLSVQGLVPQTRQFVSMFQQFLEMPQTVRFIPQDETPENLMSALSLVLTKDLLVCEYDVIPHDGTLPGADGKKVAAITKILEIAGQMPDIFMPMPGNFDPRRLLKAAIKATGVNYENFLWRPQDAQKAMQAMGGGAGGPPPPQGGGGPQAPTGAAPGPAPESPAQPKLPLLNLPPAAPPAVRPGNQ